MMVTTTFSHKTQDCKLKSYINKIIENLNFYTDLITGIQVTFEADSCRKGNAKDAFDQLSNKLKNSVRHKKGTEHS